MRKKRVETKVRPLKLKGENAYLTRDKSWLEEQYYGKNLSIKAMSLLIPCDYGSMRKALIRAKIPLKPKYITYSNPVYPSRSGANNGMWIGGRPNCQDCGTKLSAYTALRCKKCQGIASRGENNPSWKPPEECYGGEAMQARNSVEYDIWRFAVYKRDKNICILCGVRKDPMVAHHLDGFNLFPEKRYDVDNGITLCDYHHIAFHSNYGFGNNTKEQFEDFKIRTTEMTY
jgi:hypothetical protein